MSDHHAIAVIPCRMAAERLPGKPLADIHGRPMVAWVVERCLQAQRVQRVIVATDDAGIAAAARDAGAEAAMTGAHHQTGSDRVAQVARDLGLLPHTRLVNVQGDEPLVDPADIDAVVSALDAADVQVATAAAPLVGDPHDPARVKVVCDPTGRALYFSRAAIPAGGPYRVHLGLYAFRVSALLRFTSLPRTPLEQVERLEQLRLVEHGLHIQVVPVAAHRPSVDTPADLERVRSLMATASGAGSRPVAPPSASPSSTAPLLSRG